ncbi:MAG: hypothetical protein KKE84_06545 [Gammaproteobacteria bacterium]|nr:hypothetical protein [Gammaproteobacteria bacterium]
MTEINPNEQEAGARGFWHRYRLPIIVAVIGIAIIGWLVVSKGTAVRQAQETVAAQRAEWVKQAEARQAGMVKQSLNLFGVPLAWAVRREMMAGNLDQVDQYVTDLVKLEGVEGVTVAQADGSVAVASDRRHLGTAFGGLYAERHLTAEQITAEETAPGQWLLVVPVMGLNARLGTVAIEYRAPPSAPSAPGE